MIFPLCAVCLNISTIFPLSIFHPFLVLAPAVPAAVRPCASPLVLSCSGGFIVVLVLSSYYHGLMYACRVSLLSSSWFGWIFTYYLMYMSN